MPGYANPIGRRGYGGWGRVAGWDHGGGWGLGHGWRHRHWSLATDPAGWQRETMGRPSFPMPAVSPPVPTRQQQLDALKGQAAYLEDALSDIRQQIQELKSDKTDKNE